jgi:hypothetical protein
MLLVPIGIAVFDHMISLPKLYKSFISNFSAAENYDVPSCNQKDIMVVSGFES